MPLKSKNIEDMKTLFLVIVAALSFASLSAQDKNGSTGKPLIDNTLPGMDKCILQAQGNVLLFIQNLDSNSEEQNVNHIIIDFQQYIDSLPANKSRADVLLVKHFAPLRMFFLTTTNKTTVATSFLAPGPPFRFCLYNDTASALFLGAVKNGEIYNLAKMTEGRILKAALMNCLLPSLKALDEFKNNEVKYVGLSIYYGAKDSRDGAPTSPVTPFCLTLVASLADIQQYNAGIITAKGLLANATLYLSGVDDAAGLRRISVNFD